MYVFQEYENRETLIKSLTGTIAEELRVALSNKREVTLAVPGGSTPKPLFQALSLVKIEWERNGDAKYVQEKLIYAWKHKKQLSKNAREWYFKNCRLNNWVNKMRNIIK